MNNIKIAQTLLYKWDNLEPIETIEMGGLGPGYELGIQTAAIEFLREGLNVPLEGPEEDYYRVFWEGICVEALAKRDEALGGITGAMYGAAKQLSWFWLHNGGPHALVEMIKKEYPNRKIIQCSKRGMNE